MAVFERPYNSLDELHETELEHHKKMIDSGVPLAVPAAMFYCARHGLNPPWWLVLESAKTHCASLLGNAPKKRGRSSGVVNRYRQDANHYARWDAVVEIRERRKSLQKEVDALRSLPGRQARNILKEYMKLLDWVGSNDLAAFECAAILLDGTRAQGGPDAVKKSYQKVERNMRNPGTAMRYYMLDPAFLRLIGAAIEPARQGKKILPLCDLRS